MSSPSITKYVDAHMPSSETMNISINIPKIG